MRNPCKHKGMVELEGSALLEYRFLWCENCGATRMDIYKYHHGRWVQGAWKSPKLIRGTTGSDASNMNLVVRIKDKVGW